MDPLVIDSLRRAADVADKIGLWQKLWARLMGDPRTAAQHLRIALREVRRTLSSLRETILEISYLGVEGQDERDVLRALDRIESGALYEEVILAKGSCHKIERIYDKHLNAWFNGLKDQEEVAYLEKLFDELKDSDGWAIAALEKLLREAKKVTPDIRALVKNKREKEACSRAAAFAEDLKPTLEKLSATMAYMLEQEAAFIEKRGITG